MFRKSLTLLFLLVCVSIFAKERSVQDMKAIASSILNVQNTRSTESELACLDETGTYCIYGNEAGFVVISRDDRSDAVLGFSSTPYNKSDIPCGLSWWLNAVDATLQHTDIRATPQTLTRGETVVVEPMIEAKWGQGDPYNSKCPTFKGKKAPTGCVATAMVQLMFYYKYPEKATGVGYYTLGDASHKYSITVNSTYNWNMLKASYAGSWFMTDEEKENIGQLNYDAGVATHMNYASDGSGSNAFDAANGLSHIFQFDSLAINCVSRECCSSDDEWREVIIQEFINKHPLIMCGMDKNTGGHAFLIDGIDAEGLIHVNWGWNGSYDGYYNLTDLNPKDKNGVATSSHYNSMQTVVTNLRLTPEPLEGEKYRSRWVLDKEEDFVSDQMNGFFISGPELYKQYYHLTFYGKFGVRFVDSQGKEALFVTLFDTSRSNLSPVDGGLAYYVSYFNHVTSSDLSSLPEGTYTAYLASKALQDEEPQFICYPGGKHNEYTITKDANGVLTITKSQTSGIKSIVDSQHLNSVTIYDLQGRNLGTDFSQLPKGIYIIGGKKVVK